MSKRICLICFFCLFLVSGKGISQVSGSKITIGFDAMGNILQGDFNNHPLSYSGDIFLRWDAVNWISVCGAITFGRLRTSLDALELTQLPDYPQKIETDYSSFQIYAAIPIYQSWFVPQILLGGEFMHFNPAADDGSQLPPKSFTKNVFGFLIGLGFEFQLNTRLSIDVKTVLHLSGTDNLDYYVAGSNPDAFTTFGAGLSYSFGGTGLDLK